MTLHEVSRVRLWSQRVSGGGLAAAYDVVAWMGAMQAQDYGMAKWAVGARLTAGTVAAVDAALDDASVFRTHLLRPTWHLVAREDLRWILELTAPRIKASLRSRHKELELTPSVLRKSDGLLEKSLRDGRHLTREELLAKYRAARFELGDNRASHLLMRAELDGIICSGRAKGGKPTYALLDERVPSSKPIQRDEALAMLARRYFASRGAATREDFVWWSGLPRGDARRAVEMVKGELEATTLGSREYLLAASAAPTPRASEAGGAVYLLPAFDELLISYADRSASMAGIRRREMVSSNGVFRPVIVMDGQVVGIWRRSVVKGGLAVETQLFRRLDRRATASIDAAAGRLGTFMGLSAESTSMRRHAIVRAWTSPT